MLRASGGQDWWDRRGYSLDTADRGRVLYFVYRSVRKHERAPFMAQDGVRYQERLLRQAGKETDRERLDKLTAEIYRVVAEREKIRAKPRPRSRGI